MDIIDSISDKTYTMAVIMDIREVAVGAGLVAAAAEPRPLYRILLRQNTTTAPYHKRIHRLEEHYNFLNITEGALHWDITDDKDENLNVAQESGAFNLNVRQTTPFVLHLRPTEKEYEDRVKANNETLATLLACTDRTPYHEDEDGKCFDIPMDKELHQFIRATEQFGKLVDIRRNEWLWLHHPAYNGHKHVLVTMAFFLAFNQETQRSEIYLGIYRGSAPIAVGAFVRFWEHDMQVVKCGVVGIKNKSLVLYDTDISACKNLETVEHEQVFQYANKRDVKAFDESMRKCNLGAWHTSLQYANGKWFKGKGAPTISLALEKFLLSELDRHQSLNRLAYQEAAAALEAAKAAEVPDGV